MGDFLKKLTQCKVGNPTFLHYRKKKRGKDSPLKKDLSCKKGAQKGSSNLLVHMTKLEKL